MEDPPPLVHLLDDVPAPDLATLRSVVRKRDRGIRKVLAGVGFVCLGVGIGATYFATKDQAHVPPVQLVASPNISSPSSSGSDNVAPGQSPTVFNKVASSVDESSSINVFRRPANSCLHVTVSRPEWATTLDIGEVAPSDNNLTVLTSSVIGVAEGTPRGLIVARVGQNVKSVKLTSSSGDQSLFTPTNGFVLITPSTGVSRSTFGTINALSNSGQTLASSQLPVSPLTQCTPVA